MAPLTDTHLHLTDSPYVDAASVTLEKAAHNGVHKVIVPGYSPESLDRIRVLKRTFPEVAVAVGYHPAYILACQSQIPDLHSWISDVNPVAVGEIGLDNRQGFPSMNLQKAFFSCQLEVAVSMNLPVIIHCVGAHPECLSILRRFHKTSPLRGVLHRANCSPDIAKEYMEVGMYSGFGPELLDTRRKNLQMLAQCVPLDHVLFETDAPYCKNPQGDVFHPWDLPYIAEIFAGIRNITLREMEQVSEENTHRLFGI